MDAVMTALDDCVIRRQHNRPSTEVLNVSLMRLSNPLVLSLDDVTSLDTVDAPLGRGRYTLLQ